MNSIPFSLRENASGHDLSQCFHFSLRAEWTSKVLERFVVSGICYLFLIGEKMI